MYTRFPSLIFKANLKQPKIYIFLESNNAVDEKYNNAKLLLLFIIKIKFKTSVLVFTLRTIMIF